MQRIDTLNVREDLFGLGKAGFHDNADLPGQDATYLSPDWLNAVQEELCNVLELSGVVINPESKRQLFDLLITRKNLVNDLTTGGIDQVLTAEMGKILNDQAFGVRQNYADKISSRVFGVNYTNTKPYTIFVLITMQGLDAGVDFHVDNESVIRSDLPPVTGFLPGGVSICAPVPPGSQYSAINSGGTLRTWKEF